MSAMLTRASQAVEDALASDDNHPNDIARAVLMAVRTPVVGVWIDADCDDDVHPIDCFTAMIDAILSETT